MFYSAVKVSNISIVFPLTLLSINHANRGEDLAVLRVFDIRRSNSKIESFSLSDLKETCNDIVSKKHKSKKSKASFIYEQRPIGRYGPRGPKQQRPRGSQPSCNMDADQL